ncbi:hypothetical protein EMCRGX_G018518 [Ephydatia muelleri]
MGGTMCNESNHLSANDFLWAYGILRILKKYTAYCLMNHHHPCMQNASNQFHQKAKQWVELFLSIKEEGHQKKYVTPYMHAECIHAFYTVGKHLIGTVLGVEKHNDDAKRNYFSSNRWDAPADIMMTEYRLEVLQEYSREKRAYTKRDSAYWHEALALRSNEHVSYSLQVVEDHDLYKRIPADVNQMHRKHIWFAYFLQTNPVNQHQLK